MNENHRLQWKWNSKKEIEKLIKNEWDLFIWSCLLKFACIKNKQTQNKTK